LTPPASGLPKAGITEEQAVVVWRLIGNVLNLIATYNTYIAAQGLGPN